MYGYDVMIWCVIHVRDCSEGEGDSPEFDTITWSVLTVSVAFVTFVGVCCRGGYPFDEHVTTHENAQAGTYSSLATDPTAASSSSSPSPIDMDALDNLRNKLVSNRVDGAASNGGSSSTCAACNGNRWSPEAHLGWFSRLTFVWLNPLMRAGNDHQLKFDELINVRHEDCASSIDSSFQRSWDEVTSEGRVSFARALYRSFGAPFVFAGFLKLIYDTTVFVSPQLLSAITNYLDIERNHEPWYYGRSIMLSYQSHIPHLS
jgi:hypothetical protein